MGNEASLPVALNGKWFLSLMRVMNYDDSIQPLDGSVSIGNQLKEVFSGV